MKQWPDWALVLRAAASVALLAAAGALLGSFRDLAWAGAAIVLAITLVLQWLRSAQLLRWLRTRSIADAPDANGLRGELVAQIVRLLRSRQRRKRQLMRLLRTVRRATAALPEGVVMLSEQAEIAWFNRAAARLLRLSRKSDRGLRIDNLLRQPEFVDYLRGRRYDAPVRVRMGMVPEQFLNLQLVHFGEGQLLLLVSDATHENQVEAMRKDFVANASHELRSPLTVIAGYLETLAADDGIEPALQGPMREMRRQAERMQGIIADLLSLSRLETGDPEVAGEPVDVGLLLKQVERDILSRQQRPRLVHSTAESNQWLRGDHDQLYSLVRNLMENAANYTPADGEVRARWWVDAAGGHLAVTDTGIGIAADHIPRLTERFYRVDVGRSRATGGSGLGLAIVKHVLQKHGGRLEIASVEGRGSSFTCHFPAERLLRRPASRAAAAL
jgi:two-component system, OmpR family, phosphate regulon sensor histidine kinase PhoR